MRYIVHATVALLCLFPLATSASGECAWALWVKRSAVNMREAKSIEEDDWELDAAVPTYSACLQAAKQRATRNLAGREDVNVKQSKMNSLIGGGFAVHVELKQPEYASFTYTFRCFPDTVDPRGPKGK